MSDEVTSAAHRSDSAVSLGAIGVLAMCVVTATHEAFGHGAVCLALGGHITQLTSSLFRCDVRSRWIAPAGPGMNLLLGALALALRRHTVRAPTLHLLLVFLSAFAWFWEGGYCVQAMIKGDGDLYFAAQDFIGRHEIAWRIAGVVLGLVLYLTTIRLTSTALQRYFGDAARARRAARWGWLGATLAAGVAAAAYAGPGVQDLHDALFEIGVAAVPLLGLRAIHLEPAPGVSAPPYASRSALLLAACAYACFVLTLGVGLGSTA
jgi:hypothetical protein